MSDLLIGFAILGGGWIIVSVLFMVGLYWCHYPYGRRKKWRGQ